MNQAEIQFWNKYYLIARNLDKFLAKNILRFFIDPESVIEIIDSIAEAMNPFFQALQELAEIIVENVELT